MTNPLTLIEQANIVSKIKYQILSWYLDEGDYQPTEEEAMQKSEKIIDHLLLSIAKGEVARLEGMKKETELVPNGPDDYDHCECEVCYEKTIYNSAISDSLEHWNQVIKFLEK